MPVTIVIYYNNTQVFMCNAYVITLRIYAELRGLDYPEPAVQKLQR